MIFTTLTSSKLLCGIVLELFVLLRLLLVLFGDRFRVSRNSEVVNWLLFRSHIGVRTVDFPKRTFKWNDRKQYLLAHVTQDLLCFVILLGVVEDIKRSASK